MNEVKKFMNETFGALTVIDIEGQAWFMGREIVQKLGYEINNTTSYMKYIKRFVLEEDTKKMNNSNLELFGIKDGGRKGEVLINTFAIYDLVSKSPLPAARQFQIWITHEVLPSIEKHGGYIPGNTPEEIEQKAKEIADSMVKDLKDENRRIQRNYSDVSRSNEDVAFSEYYISECMDAIAEQLMHYKLNLRRDRYMVDDVIEKCGVSYQSVIDALYRAGWISFDSYKVPQFNPLYIMQMSPEVKFNTDGFNTIVAYFNSKKNRVPKLIYHDKNKK